jgi:hypothetical protein
MLEVEIFLSRPEIAFSDRDPSDPLSGWKSVGKGSLVDLPSVGDQKSIAPGEVVRVRGVMHLAAMDGAARAHEPTVRLMVDFLAGPDVVGPAR